MLGSNGLGNIGYLRNGTVHVGVLVDDLIPRDAILYNFELTAVSLRQPYGDDGVRAAEFQRFLQVHRHFRTWDYSWCVARLAWRRGLPFLL